MITPTTFDETNRLQSAVIAKLKECSVCLTDRTGEITMVLANCVLDTKVIAVAMELREQLKKEQPELFRGEPLC